MGGRAPKRHVSRQTDNSESKLAPRPCQGKLKPTPLLLHLHAQGNCFKRQWRRLCYFFFRVTSLARCTVYLAPDTATTPNRTLLARANMRKSLSRWAPSTHVMMYLLIFGSVFSAKNHPAARLLLSDNSMTGAGKTAQEGNQRPLHVESLLTRMSFAARTPDGGGSLDFFCFVKLTFLVLGRHQRYLRPARGADPSSLTRWDPHFCSAHSKPFRSFPQ